MHRRSGTVTPELAAAAPTIQKMKTMLGKVGRTARRSTDRKGY
jgi:hypothetical protein